MVKTRGLSHINLNVSDIKRSLEFYRKAFGLEVQFWEGKTMVFLRTPGASDTITLCQAKEGEPIAGGGVSHFGFGLAQKGQFEEYIEQVKDAGGKLIRRGQHAPGVPYAYFADPDGYVIEL
jgi:lactoylglutathione lyase